MTSFVKLALALLFVTACSSSEPDDSDADAAVADAAVADAALDSAVSADAALALDAAALECTRSVSLVGSNSATPTTLDFAALDSEGATICLTLDSTENLVAAHFAANTEYEMGPTSPFEMVLFDEDGAVLREGWDVTVGQSDPRTFTNLEHSFPVGEVTQAKLFIRHPETASDAMELTLSFFEPFE